MSVATYGFEDVACQAWMLLDRVRMEAFASAIRKAVRPGDVVADIGAGSGVLAAIAAKAGASKVYAVERSGMASLAQQVAIDNGVEGIVEVLRRDAREVTFARAPDVLVSETFGSFAVDEDILGLLSVVRRHCRPGVRVVPQAFEVVLAPLCDAALARELDELVELQGVRLGAVRSLLGQRVAGHSLREGDVVGAPVSTGRLETAVSTLPDVFRARLVVDRDGPVNAIGAWFDADLFEGVRLSTSPFSVATCWTNPLFPIDPPLSCHRGDALEVEIHPRLLQTRALWAWSIRHGGELRIADALNAATGTPIDIARQLGLSSRPSTERAASGRLDAWTSILEGGGAGTVTQLAERLLLSMPQRYGSVADARQEVLALLAAADALKKK